MDLKPWQQRMLFVLVVAGLAVLGVYLVTPSLHHSPAASPTPSASATAPGSPAPVAGSQTPVAVSTPATLNIYNWLPFTQAELSDAAGVVTAFSSAYVTFRYTDSVGVYIGRMNGLITSSLAGVLRADYQTPGLASQRTSQRQVASGTGSIDEIRSFGASSITFVVTVTQRMVSTQGTAITSPQYAITATSSGTSWQVNDIEPATAGNT